MPADGRIGVVVNYAPMTHPILARHAYIVAAMTLRGESRHLGRPPCSGGQQNIKRPVVEVPNKAVGLVTAAIRVFAVSAGVVAPRV